MSSLWLRKNSSYHHRPYPCLPSYGGDHGWDPESSGNKSIVFWTASRSNNKAWGAFGLLFVIIFLTTQQHRFIGRLAALASCFFFFSSTNQPEL